MRTRSRRSDNYVTGEVTTRNRYWNGSDWVPNPNPNRYQYSWYGGSKEITHDGIHDWPPEGGSSSRDIGGTFESEKSEVVHAAPFVDLYWDHDIPNYTRYRGAVPAHANYVVDSGVGSSSSESQLEAYGATAISRAIPTAPAANVSVMLGELFREGVPRAVGAQALKSRFRDYRDIGGEYLNYEFGWKPIAADLKSVSQAIVDSEKILQQLERDSGQRVRRKFAFPSINRSSASSGGSRSHPAATVTPSGMIWNAESWAETSFFSQRRWFSGCFTYHFERPRNRFPMVNAALNAQRLLGLELTPETVWNLAPWSWLADWVSNAGDVMTNVSRFAKDGLAMQYGYIMEETTVSSTLLLNRIGCSPSWGTPDHMRLFVNTSVTATSNKKLRMPASPWGFGLTGEDFDPRQWAILGALGISRGPSTL